jgi:hypothetical protein
MWSVAAFMIIIFSKNCFKPIGKMLRFEIGSSLKKLHVVEKSKIIF